jgi:hypothetical protein
MIRSAALAILAALAFGLFRLGGLVPIIAAILILPFAGMQLLSVAAMLISDLRAVSLLNRSRRHQRGDYSKD